MNISALVGQGSVQLEVIEMWLNPGLSHMFGAGSKRRKAEGKRHEDRHTRQKGKRCMTS